MITLPVNRRLFPADWKTELREAVLTQVASRVYRRVSARTWGEVRGRTPAFVVGWRIRRTARRELR